MRDRVRAGVNGHVTVFADTISRVDSVDMETELKLYLVTVDGTRLTASGIHAIEAAMLLCPAALENRRMRWARHMWSLHNLVGHPLMQLLAAFWVHDVTVPKPRP